MSEERLVVWGLVSRAINGLVFIWASYMVSVGSVDMFGEDARLLSVGVPLMLFMFYNKEAA